MENAFFTTVMAVFLVMNSAAPAYEGFGAATRGGAGGDTYHVTSLTDTNTKGTLRYGILSRTGPRTIIFDVGGVITLVSDLHIRIPYLSIDGGTAPAPGITLRKPQVSTGMMTISGTHDIIIRSLRFWGDFAGGIPSTQCGTFAIDGDAGPDHVVDKVILDHNVFRNSNDSGPDIWGEVHNLTFSWNLVFYNYHPQTISFYAKLPWQKRDGISIHHNIYARNNDRNPQLRADNRSIDFVNNIIYHWGHFEGTGDGLRIKNSWSGPEPKTNMNIINNYFISKNSPSRAIVYGEFAGRDSKDNGPATPLAQGAVYTSSDMGQLWVSGNILPQENQDQYSTVSSPLAIPAAARVTTYMASELAAKVVPFAGTKYPDAEERLLLAEIAGAMGGKTPPHYGGLGDGAGNGGGGGIGTAAE